MSEDFIQASSLMTNDNWQELMSMSELDIEKNAVDDIDNPPFSLDNLSYRPTPNTAGKMIYFVPVEQNIDIWLREHNLQAEVVASALLKQFVEAQSGLK